LVLGLCTVFQSSLHNHLVATDNEEAFSSSTLTLQRCVHDEKVAKSRLLNISLQRKADQLSHSLYHINNYLCKLTSQVRQ